jgi:hypothetical protein
MDPTALYIFGGTFVTVFALGLQSLNVNGGHYWAAALTSFAIAGGNLVILKFVPQGEITQLLAYLAAGPLAIVASMTAHRRIIGVRALEQPVRTRTPCAWRLMYGGRRDLSRITQFEREAAHYRRLPNWQVIELFERDQVAP